MGCERGVVKLFRDLSQLPNAFRRGGVSIGNFDGVHLGHARIVERLKALSKAVNGPAVIFTFDPHPVRLLRPSEAPPPLTWTDRKAQLLSELGVDAMVAFPTDRALLALSPEEFFADIVCRSLGARALVEGPNFRFGQGRRGDVGLLDTLVKRNRMQLEIVAPIEVDGQIVSSSRVRQALLAGRVDEARLLLTRPYRIRGMVTHGASRGASLGFPTANVDAIDTLVPAVGVYAGMAHTVGSKWPAAIHVGPNPTFGEQALKIEVHLIGYQGSLYGEPLEVDFLSRLRDTRPFASVDELKTQLHQDIERAAQVVRQIQSPLEAEDTSE